MKTELYKQLIEKLKELIHLLDTEPDDYNRYIDNVEPNLRKEISALEKQIEKQPQITGKLYKEVWIKSESDLPKEDGVYFCHYKKYGENSTHFYKNNLARIQRWLTDIDWYLQPIEQIEQPAVQLTDEEIERFATKMTQDPVRWNYLVDGASYARDQIKVSVRDELVKFIEYFEEQATIDTDPNCSIDGDQYLLNWIPDIKDVDGYLNLKQSK
jgi:hypothetical protein